MKKSLTRLLKTDTGRTVAQGAIWGAGFTGATLAISGVRKSLRRRKENKPTKRR